MMNSSPEDQVPEIEPRGGEKIDWAHARPGEPLPTIPEVTSERTYDLTEAPVEEDE